MADINEFHSGDTDNNLLRKILARLHTGIPVSGLVVNDLEIGAVEIKDGTGDARAVVVASAPAGTEDGLIVRNIPSGTQAVSGPLTNTELRASAISVSGTLVVSAQEFTRPNDTTQYATNDAVSNSTTAPSVITFSNVGRTLGGTGYITNVRIVKSTNVTGSAQFRLWLYNTAPAAINDNSPFTLLYANRAIRLGYVDFSMATEGAGSDSASAMLLNVNMKFSCAAASKDIYGVLEAKAAYTPGAQEKFWIELTADQN